MKKLIFKFFPEEMIRLFEAIYLSIRLVRVLQQL